MSAQGGHGFPLCGWLHTVTGEVSFGTARGSACCTHALSWPCDIVPGREPRGAIDAYLAIEGERVRVIVTHLGLRAAERRYQVRRLLEALSQGQSRCILLLGDINEWILRSRPLRWLYDRFGTPPAPRTFPSWLPLFPLDRIWVLPRERLLEVRAHATPLSRIASDHLPVKAVIAIKPGIEVGRYSHRIA